MRISVFGLGYVGAVCAGCLSARGHEATGADVSSTRVDPISRGRSPIVEPDLEMLLRQGQQTGQLSGITDFKKVVLDSDISFICVDTPGKRNDDLDLGYIETICREVGFTIRERSERHTMVVRSIVLPGTVNNIVVPLIEDCSSEKTGVNFGAGTNPEFLRESTAIKDYDFSPMTMIGELDKQVGNFLEEIYHELDAPIIREATEVAEMIRYTYNVRYAARVTFANKIGNIAKAAGIGDHEVMDVTYQDHKPSLPRCYMCPGFAFGGFCLSKDVRALTYRTNQLDVEHPMLSSLMHNNPNQVQKAFDLTTSHDTRKVGLPGLSFKAGTDDLRESPLMELVEMLIGKGYELRIFDHNVGYACVRGASKEYIRSKIPHVSSLLVSDFDEVAVNSDVPVLGNGDELFVDLVNKTPSGKKLVDLVGLMPHTATAQAKGTRWQRVALGPVSR